MLENKKNFEYRENDRDYQVGDMLWLKEWNPQTEVFTGRSLAVEVDCVVSKVFNLPDNYVIMGTHKVKQHRSYGVKKYKKFTPFTEELCPYYYRICLDKSKCIMPTSTDMSDWKKQVGKLNLCKQAGEIITQEEWILKKRVSFK
jgi:hypothetical protein